MENLINIILNLNGQELQRLIRFAQSVAVMRKARNALFEPTCEEIPEHRRTVQDKRRKYPDKRELPNIARAE